MSRERPLPVPGPRAEKERARTLADVTRDQALVEAARAGSRHAFDELVRRHRPRIVALARRVTRNAADAEDVAQEAFARAFRRLHRFEGRCQFSSWLHRIAFNRALSHLASTRAHRAYSLDDHDPGPGDPRIHHADPHEAYERRERTAALACAVAWLTPSLRRTLQLVVVEGMTQHDAATLLGCRSGTVGWRLHRARAALRRALDASDMSEGVQPSQSPAVTPPTAGSTLVEP